MSKLKARQPEEIKPGKTKALIYGGPGIGKTWFATSFPKPYYMDHEGGGDLGHYQARLKEGGGAYFGVADGSMDFQTVIDQITALETEKHPYKTLIFDSITKLYQTAIANEAERLGDKDAFGASKKPAIAFMRRLVARAHRLDMNVLFVAHETSEWGVNPKNGQREEIGKTADVWDKLIYELHLGLRAIRQGNSRKAIVTKSRLLGFPEQSMFPLEYSEFASRYGKDFIEADVEALTLATPEQIAEIKRILELVKVPDSEIEKALTKGNASELSELSTDHASKMIEWLKKKLQ